MASNWLSDPKWDAQGKPYVEYLADGPGVKRGEIRYIAPNEVQQSNAYGEDPRLMAWANQIRTAPGQTYLRNRGNWNARTGQWDQGVNWTNLMTTGVALEIGSPYLMSALASGAPAAAAGPGTSAIAPTATSLAVPTATATALNTSPYVLGAIGPAATTGGLTAAQMAAITGAGAIPTVANLMGNSGSQADPANNRPPGTQANGNAADPLNNQPPGNNNPNTNAFQLPLGLTGRDLIGYGSNFLNNYLNRQASGEYNEARAAADKAALDFAMRAYDEQNAKEQARWDVTEQRRVPYRAASRDTLAEFRRLLGIGE